MNNIKEGDIYTRSQFKRKAEIMYSESGYFDSSQAPTYDNNGLEDSRRISATFSLENLSNPTDEAAAAALGLDQFQSQLGFDFDQELHSHLIQQDAPPPMVDPSNWAASMQEIQEATAMHHHQLVHHQNQFDEQQQQQQHIEAHENLQCYDTAATAPYPPPDLLNLIHLPRCSTLGPVFPPATSISFAKPSGYPLDMFGELPDAGSVLYDSSLHLGYPTPPNHNILKDLFHPLSQNYGLFCGVEEGEGCAVGGVEGGVFQEMERSYRKKGKGDKDKEEYCTEKQRREQLNAKFQALKSLIPNPTKGDRASIVGDAIDYISELGRTIEELRILVDKKKLGRERRRMVKSDEEAVAAAAAAADVESSSMRPLAEQHDYPLNGALRSSWLQRRSKESSVDVRIIDDEVNIKLTQKKKTNCLLPVAKALDELQLGLVHVAGGFIGDHYIFMFNTKIGEGSSIYAGAIATKLIEAMDKQQSSPTPAAFHGSF